MKEAAQNNNSDDMEDSSNSSFYSLFFKGSDESWENEKRNETENEVNYKKIF